MDPKPDKECENRGDIVLLSEIISNSIYWQEIEKICNSNFSVINMAPKSIFLL